MSAFENFPRITPFLWFASNAAEAVDFYLTVFKNSRRLDETRNVDGAPLTDVQEFLIMDKSRGRLIDG